MKNSHRNRTTQNSEYTDRLIRKQKVWWKQVVDVQAPYRWNLQRLRPGYTLEIGCGIGRNLEHLKGRGVGIDHNLESVEFAKRKGLIALSVDEFQKSPFNAPQLYDSLLLAHVVEHMTQQKAIDLIRMYLPNLKPGGKVILITPQEAGYKSDSTHVEFIDFVKLRNINSELGLSIMDEYSFPFPWFVGLVFTYNEFISVSCKPE
jgi:2-polyprenyl-3-methyl-5-hydroxy-6-metoxy-1,4-benzoquinol methylase